ncbi:hypothetical protein CPter91_1532 [Collimonas pratensis]|uniref:Uncharacterized protein n=1 Tax=Collimonas pratensis TaxID=279113 RepID=A0A127Q1E5_9BURK|nr:hypothetical protein CPter91_1532 [Collimonas pratensis]
MKNDNAAQRGRCLLHIFQEPAAKEEVSAWQDIKGCRPSLNISLDLTNLKRIVKSGI